MKQNLLASFNHTVFFLIRMKYVLVIKEFKLNILRLLVCEIIETRGITDYLITASKNFTGHAFGC